MDCTRFSSSGAYGITGCKTWLVVVCGCRGTPPIVFPLELCNTDQVGVQEAQVVVTGEPR